MRTKFKTDAISFARSFLFLVMIARVLSNDLFEDDPVAGFYNREVFYPIELVFNEGELVAKFPLLSISEVKPWNDGVRNSFLPSHFYTKCFVNALTPIQNPDKVNAPSFHSSCNRSRLFNIPHQNSDEDAAIIFSGAVA
jgi:hypothetical protein